jgi:aspartyl-tRNA(Asn)/glutamyl-tRNA(Gln) amidotransferase subunit A
MVTEVEVCYLSIAELSRAFAGGELSPVEVTAAYLGRIDQFDERLHCYITVTAEAARAAAEAAEARLRSGAGRGPLDGVPIALKDLYDTAGVRTTGHSPLYADRVPTADATTVRLLNEAGAVPLGKLSMHEFASGAPELDGIFPPARNPWNTDLMPGGSSSGSGAALVAGLCAGALGSDTGGSIRGPASFCGIVGLKPTYGLISRVGVLPLSWTLDHAGPMTRTVEDAALLLQVLAGHDPADPASARVEIPDYRAALAAGVAGLRIGAPLSYVESAPDLDPETYATYKQALAAFERLGARVEPLELPDVEHATVIGWVLTVAEAFAFHEPEIHARPELFGRNFYNRVLQGALVSGADYIQALRGRNVVCESFAGVMATYDLLALPTSPQPAYGFGEEAGRPNWKRTSFTRPFNVTGQPALSLPCGFNTAGLPIGLQLVGRPFADATVLAAAQAYEQAHDWYRRRPI